ncbi:hypothetical protein GUJ93_ZPchr0001g32484 [Zizania palustris]|uniref:F-box/LRR-repeat protein 15/At3g58940/PEG3-like LRR domain-containing protein n=1 Tax=Zizania palustris TaxID=103762 RepID=A0A8J5VL40_ZIZPA|nr:hypothetical protein GUJ93_ZPchr0001g32484 [Zizania palustris]
MRIPLTGPGRKLRKESLLVGLVVPPAVPGRASVQSCRFYLDMAQNEGSDEDTDPIFLPASSISSSGRRLTPSNACTHTSRRWCSTSSEGSAVSSFVFLKFILQGAVELQKIVVVLANGEPAWVDEMRSRLMPLATAKRASNNPTLLIVVFEGGGAWSIHRASDLSADTKAIPSFVVLSIKILAIMVSFGVLNEVTMPVSLHGCFPNVETMRIKNVAVGV